NEPGREEWEGFTSATRAAARGGITTLIDMPLNCVPPTTTAAALAQKRLAAKEKLAVDVGFWGGAVPANLDPDAPAGADTGTDELAAMHDAGVFGFKCFLSDSGVPEFPALDADRFEAAALRAARLGAMLIVHAEDQAALDAARGAGAAESGARSSGGPAREYAHFLASRPDVAETAAIARVVEVARRTGARVHILHLSSALALPLIAAAKADGVALTVETCPHYLLFAAEDVPHGATEFKCCPPIRSAENRERLWEALGSGLIDFDVSDHSPCTPDLKRRASGDFAAAWGGIASVQLSLPAVWTAASRRGWGLARVVELMSSRPADFAGLPHKGRIEVGCDADLVVFDPDASFTVDAAKLAHRHPVTPYHGVTLTGVVKATYLRSLPVKKTAQGKPLRRFKTLGAAPAAASAAAWSAGAAPS
ncbi:MAG: allantoinase AllB, partial [Actinocrinis sp.]